MQLPRYASYKDSGVEWLGEIPEGWGVEKAKYIWRERNERSKTGEEQLLSVSQYYGVKPNLDQSRSESLIDYKVTEKEDLVINIMLAWLGALGTSSYEGLVSPSYAVYQPIAECNTKYLGFLYRTPAYLAEFARRSTGVVPSRWRMYTEDFGQVLTLLPHRAVQDRIVSFLDQKTAEIDEAIAKKQQLIALLQEQKSILINQAVTKGLNPDAPMKDSGVPWIGEIPAHWEVKRNRFLFVETNERSPKGEETHLSMTQKYGLIPAAEVDIQTLQSESYEGAKLCQKGDLVLNRLKAHLAVFSVSPCEGVISPDYSVFKLRDTENYSKYYEHLFKTKGYLSEFNRRVRGIVVGFYRLYSGDFYDIPSPVPPPEEQCKLLDHIEQLDRNTKSIVEHIEREVNTLQEFKITLISAAVTGKIKV